MLRLILFLTMAVSGFAADWLSSYDRTQPGEKELSPESVANLKLLWKMSFDDRLAAPVVLGPIYTHRGIKELVFFSGADNNLYSVDADLGRLFWKRHFESTSAPAACNPQIPAGPVLAPYYGPAAVEAATPRRSLFTLTSDGQIHTVRPADAYDLAEPFAFVPAGSEASSLKLDGNTLSTFITGGCNKPAPGEWSFLLNRKEAKPSVHPVAKVPKTSIWESYIVSSSASGISVTRGGRLLWTDPRESISFVVANGLVFSLSGTTLAARDIRTGKQIYSSEANGSGPAIDSLALANGHLYFVAGRTIYCYGFPIEI